MANLAHMHSLPRRKRTGFGLRAGLCPRLPQACRQIKGPLARSVSEAEAHLRITPFLIPAERPLNAHADIAPRALQLSRDSRLVFAEQPPNFAQRSVVHVVIRQTQTFARLKSAE